MKITENMELSIKRDPPFGWILLGSLGLAGLVVVSRYNFLLFHTISELFSIAVAWAVFFLVWNTRRFVKDDTFVFIGLAYLFIGIVDLLHTLSYKGMGVFDPSWGANLPTQLWIIARYMESFALMMYPMILGKTIRPLSVMGGWFGVTILLLLSIFYWSVFPVCFVEGNGLTSFKIISEYIICLFLCVGLFALYNKRDMIDSTVFRLMGFSIVTTIFSELSFTFYVNVYGLSNLVGHFFKIISFYLIYLALVRSGLIQPYSTLFKSVKESQEKYQDIFKNAQVGLFRSRLSDGRPMEVNKQCAAICGFRNTEECLSGFDHSEHHVLIQVFNTLKEKLTQTDDIKNLETRVKSHYSSLLWVTISGRFNAKKDHIEGTIVDISERKRRETVQTSYIKLIDLATRIDSKQLIQKFLDEAEIVTDSKIGFFHFVDEDQAMLSLQAWSTNTFKTNCKIPEEAALHYPISRAGIWVDCVHQRQPVIHNDYANLPHKKGLPDGHARIDRELVVPVFRVNKLVAILGVGNKEAPYDGEDIKMVQTLAESAWEVIARKKAEENLQKAHDLLEQKIQQRTHELEAAAFEFESLFNSSQVGMMVLKGGRFLTKGNQRLADILGYSTPEEMEGLSMKALHLTEKRFKEFGETFYNSLSQGEVLQVDYELKCKDGSSLWCSLSGKALDPNRPSDLDKGVLWIIEDIGERKRFEQGLRETLEKLERSNDELAQFAYVASHDLQEPLRAIVGFLQLLESRYTDQLDDKGRQYIERSVNAGHRMQTLISDLLALSRINTKGRPFESSDLNAVLIKVLERLDTGIQEKKATVTFDELPHLMVDLTQIYDLFWNLISNALKYNGQPKPVVEIGCKEKIDECCFYVKDNGIGIDPKFHQRIFIVFQRLHGRQEYSGTGVGLTLCKKIVERHGGRIWVESEKGKGSTFFFTLLKERK